MCRRFVELKRKKSVLESWLKKIGIEEFKRRLKDKKDLAHEQESNKETVHSGMHN